ncbi:uracil/xanthine transporter [Paenibacillus contaminans]|uniref:Uracil/xanthine transporter n=1 Tax=Paenibacillus contaminans TaxID=450362 RepID=A0A329MH10_9BACL|nr:uracil/xanthine transporter [Paenibacillus contaminans]RAV18972.1 uracil/xanthine transporter [Paenibacillus contaminans]
MNKGKLSAATIGLGGIQWFFFMFANTVVIPLSVGAAFQLSPEEISGALQRSFVFTGIACALQALIGHRYAVMEGQSGLWWGVTLSLCASSASLGLSLPELGGALSLGMMISGGLVALLGALGIGRLLTKWFTQPVMGVFLLLLACQLIMIFFKGMLGLSVSDKIDVPVAGLSLVIVVFVLWLSIKGKPFVRNFAILIGIVAGWIAFRLLFHTNSAAEESGGPLLALFPWGEPHVEPSILIMTIVTGLLNMTNTVAALKGAEELYGRQTKEGEYRRSFALTGTYSVVSGAFGLVPYAPYASSLGFLQSTRILATSPYFVGAIIFMTLGFVPALSGFFASMPVSVGHAVLFVAYLQLFGSAVRNLAGVVFTPATVYKIAIPAMVGLALMNIPAAAFAAVPALIRPIVSNGLLMGIVVAVAINNVFNWDKFELAKDEKPEEKKAS